MSIRNRIESLATYILSFLIILNHSIYYYMENTKKIIQVLLVLAVLLLAFLKYKPGKRLTKKFYFVLLLYFTVVALYFAFNLDGGASYVTRYLIFIPLMIFVFAIMEQANQPYILFNCLSNIIFTIACVSLIFWITASVLDLFSPISVVETGWGITIGDYPKAGYNYYYVYFETQHALGMLQNIFHFRNCGIFCEGPAYSVILSIAILTEVFLRDTINKKRILLFSITMLSNLTTIGIIFLVVILVLKWLLLNKGLIKNKLIIIPFVMIIFLIIVSILISQKTNQTSVNLRFNDYINGFHAMKESPLYGHGYHSDTEKMFKAGFTNSLSDVMVRGGLLYTLIYIVPILYMVFILFTYVRRGGCINSSDQKVIAIGTCTLFIFVTSILSMTFIMLTLVAYGYKVIIFQSKKNVSNNYWRK